MNWYRKIRPGIKDLLIDLKKIVLKAFIYGVIIFICFWGGIIGLAFLAEKFGLLH